MDFFKKLIILNSIGLLIVFVYFFWFPKKSITLIAVPLGSNPSASLDFFPYHLPEIGISPEKETISDPFSGNSGDINISLKKINDTIEISWPEEYQIYSLVFKNLGETEKIYDNKMTFGFTADKPQNRLFPKAGAVMIERIKLEPPIIIDPSFAQMGRLFSQATIIPSQGILELTNGQRYSIEALFEKDGEDKIYTGLFGFTF